MQQQQQQSKATEIKDYIYDAIAIAKSAVQMDSIRYLDVVGGGNIETQTNSSTHQTTDPHGNVLPIHSKAKNLYRDVSHKLNHITPFMEPSVQPVLQQYSQLYNARQRDLKDQPTTNKKMTEFVQEDKLLRIPSFAMEFKEIEHSNNVDNRQCNLCPVHQRPFLILKQLRDSILEGGFLFDDMYVPKQVWYQSGVEVTAQDSKVLFCQNIVDLLMSLSLTNTNNIQEWKNNLASFNMGAQKIYEHMQKQLPLKTRKEDTTPHATPSIKDSNSIGSKLFGFGKSLYKSAKGLVGGSNSNSKADLDSKEDPYIPWLLTLCEKSQFLEKWFEIIRLDEAGLIPKDLKVQLETVSYFFMLILKTFILSDLMILIERYFKKARETNFKIFPKNYKPNI